MTFCIITHTPHTLYDNKVYAYGPYIKEMNLWLKYVDKVIIVAPCKENSEVSPILLPYEHPNIEIRKIPAISLTSDSSVITSLSNDYSFDSIFSRQCESLVNLDDVVIAISTSGNSKNIVKGLETAKERGAKIISLLGNSGGIIKNYSDLTIIVDSDVTAHIQEVHRVIYHTICNFVEKSLSE